MISSYLPSLKRRHFSCRRFSLETKRNELKLQKAIESSKPFLVNRHGREENAKLNIYIYITETVTKPK